MVMLLVLSACGHYSFDAAVTRGNADGGKDANDATDASRGDGPVPLGLLVWLECDSVTGGALVDSSQQGSVASCDASAGLCPTIMATSRGNVCVFDGINDVVTVAPEARFQPATFTTAVWLRLDTQALGYRAAWIKHAAGNSQEVWGVYQFEDAIAGRRLIAGGSSTAYEYADLVGPSLGEWVHVAVSFDGNSFRAYRNGILAGVIAGAILDAQSELILGAEFTATNRASFWPGALDDARLYDHPLSDDEILALATL